MASRQIDNPAAPKDPAHPARHLPRLVQLLARQAAGVTYRTGETVEKRIARKSLQVTVGEAAFGRDAKGHVK
jgi:hypothetical protein